MRNISMMVIIIVSVSVLILFIIPLSEVSYDILKLENQKSVVTIENIDTESGNTNSSGIGNINTPNQAVGQFFGKTRDQIMSMLGLPGVKELNTSNWPKEKAIKSMETIQIKVRSKQNKDEVIKLTVNKVVAKDVQAIFKEIYETTNFRVDIRAIGGYVYRNMASDSRKVSYHSLGTAIDINFIDMPYTPNSTPAEIKNKLIKEGKYDESIHICDNDHKVVKIFEKYGWKWGGNWSKGHVDQMHFSLTDN